MCFAEEIQYRCGHFSLPVVRPCPMTTSGHNNPICQIQYTTEYIADTMCVGCERVLHTRWTLIDEWEHRWYHQRGVCSCPVNFPDLAIRFPVIDVGTEKTSQPNDETTLASSPVNMVEMKKHDSPQIKTESLITTEPQIKVDHVVEKHTNKDPPQQSPVKGPVYVGATKGQNLGQRDRVPALYEEMTDDNKTHVAVRQASQFAAEWLEDHRALHAAGQCHCRVDTKPLARSETDGTMTAEDEKVLTLHRRITSEGSSPEEWTAPSEEDISRWRKETNVPELGTRPKYTYKTRRAPDKVKYPVPLGNNMYMTEHFVIWDAELLAARVASMQIISNSRGNGIGPSVTVSNGRISAQEPIYVYQPDRNERSQELRKKGRRRLSDRNWMRGEVWQQDASRAAAPMQMPTQRAQYDYSVAPQEQQATQYRMHLPKKEQHGLHAIYGTCYEHETQAQYGMTHHRSAWHPEQENITHNGTDSMAVTPPQEHIRFGSSLFRPIHGAQTVTGRYELTPPSTHARERMQGRPASSDSDTNRTPPAEKGNTVPRPAAVVNGARHSLSQSGSGSTTTPGNNTSSGAASAAATPSRKREKSAARKLKLQQRRDEMRQRKSAANENDGSPQQRCNIIPLCGLPMGAGPESSKPHMPAFANCSLFYPVKKHCRGSSCPQFQDTRSFSPALTI